MTAEVCVMNRLAVILAADSATTVTYWNENGLEERYFKGANKIFQVSSHHPIGMMIFDSADLLKVPWEVIIKDFRKSLGAKSFNTVAEYATEFFSFIDGNKAMFPSNVQEEIFLSVIRSSVFDLLVRSGRRKAEGEDAKQVIDNAVARKVAELATLTITPCVAEGSLNDALEAHREEIVKYARELAGTFNLPEPTDVKKLVETAIEDVFKRPQEHMSTAGLVFAGFGDHNIFPSMVSYTSCGLLAGKHVHIADVSMNIDHETPAWLAPFAQRDMADTFTAGVGFDVYASILKAVVEGLASFVEKLGQSAGFDPASVGNLSELITEAQTGIGNAVLERARKEHAIPMRRILGALPVDELAELAETLINLQSLKEKVTKPSESVGGPVDVAAITRSEGMVWIKRKHYFDPAINSRYMARLHTT